MLPPGTSPAGTSPTTAPPPTRPVCARGAVGPHGAPGRAARDLGPDRPRRRLARGRSGRGRHPLRARPGDRSHPHADDLQGRTATSRASSASATTCGRSAATATCTASSAAAAARSRPSASTRGLAGRNDTEGLAYDAARNRLLIACKENPGNGLGTTSARSTPSTSPRATLSADPVFTLDRRLVDAERPFKPSAHRRPAADGRDLHAVVGPKGHRHRLARRVAADGRDLPGGAVSRSPRASRSCPTARSTSPTRGRTAPPRCSALTRPTVRLAAPLLAVAARRPGRSRGRRLRHDPRLRRPALPRHARAAAARRRRRVPRLPDRQHR